MIGPLLLALSWLLLRIEGLSLASIGIDQPRRRSSELAFGFGLMGAVAAVQQVGLAVASGDRFVLNPTLSPVAVLDNLRFTGNSVLYEELVFRGYLLYQAVRLLGRRWAVALDAAAFGIYHWFSYGVIGNPVAMVYVFLLTGMFGWAWARAFVATGSVAAPIGLHLGWNAVAYLLFSAGPLGAAVLVPVRGTGQLSVSGWASLVLNVLLPLAAVAAVLSYCRRIEVAEARNL